MTNTRTTRQRSSSWLIAIFSTFCWRESCNLFTVSSSAPFPSIHSFLDSYQLSAASFLVVNILIVCDPSCINIFLSSSLSPTSVKSTEQSPIFRNFTWKRVCRFHFCSHCAAPGRRELHRLSCDRSSRIQWILFILFQKTNFSQTAQEFLANLVFHAILITNKISQRIKISRDTN